MMMLSPARKTHAEHSFNAFCTKVMRFEARNCYREIKRKELREISLDYLMDELGFVPESTEAPFGQTDLFADFNIRGHPIIIENETLTFALHSISAERRDLILQYYFLHVKAKDLATMYGCAHNTINDRIRRIRILLRKEMERIKHEEV